MKTWTVKTVPMYPSRRWYALHYNGPQPLRWLKDGRTWGRYKNKRDALARAAELNASGYGA